MSKFDWQRKKPLCHYHNPLMYSTASRIKTCFFALTLNELILVCLTILLASCSAQSHRFSRSFAEECWVVLHYGNSPSFDEDRVIVDEIELEMDDDEDVRDFPRQGHSEILPLIFVQSLPVPEPKKAVDLLKFPSSLSRARAADRYGV